MSPIYDQERLFLATNWGYLQAYDAATGKELWNTCGTERKLFQPTMALLSDGSILRCDGQQGVAIFNPENGELIRAMEPLVKMHTASVPLVLDNTVFCGTSEVGCCAFDAKTLTVLWDMKDTMKCSILSTVQYRGPQILMEALQEYEPYLKNPPTIISGDMNIEVQRYELLAWDKAISDHVGQMMEIKVGLLLKPH